MTKEQAIEILQTKSCVNCNFGAISPRDCLVLECELKSAINMAIKALEQQSSEDCVSRQKVKEGMRKYGFHSPDMTITEFIEDELPPVTPARKSGLHWIERFDNESMWLECPHCHIDSIAAYNYCPNCGASFKEEMRGEK